MDLEEASELVARQSGVEQAVALKVLNTFFQLRGGVIASSVREGLPFSLGELGSFKAVRHEYTVSTEGVISDGVRYRLEYVESARCRRFLERCGSIRIRRPKKRGSPSRAESGSGGRRTARPVDANPSSDAGAEASRAARPRTCEKSVTRKRRVRCSVCGVEVNASNLEKHMNKVHRPGRRPAGARKSGRPIGTSANYSLAEARTAPRQTRTMCACGCPAIPGGTRCYACSSD